jgi:hypothetical protein
MESTGIEGLLMSFLLRILLLTVLTILLKIIPAGEYSPKVATHEATT